MNKLKKFGSYKRRTNVQDTVSPPISPRAGRRNDQLSGTGELGSDMDNEIERKYMNLNEAKQTIKEISARLSTVLDKSSSSLDADSKFVSSLRSLASSSTFSSLSGPLHRTAVLVDQLRSLDKDRNADVSTGVLSSLQDFVRKDLDEARQQKERQYERVKKQLESASRHYSSQAGKKEVDQQKLAEALAERDRFTKEFESVTATTNRNLSRLLSLYEIFLLDKLASVLEAERARALEQVRILEEAGDEIDQLRESVTDRFNAYGVEFADFEKPVYSHVSRGQKMMAAAHKAKEKLKEKAAGGASGFGVSADQQQPSPGTQSGSHVSGTRPVSPGRSMCFSVDLYQLCERERQFVPKLVQRACDYLDRHLDSEGLFRLSGSASQIDTLRRGFDSGDDISFQAVLDANVVAGLLKLFLRSLPEPLLTYAAYDELVALTVNSSTSVEEQVINLRSTMLSLPPFNRFTANRLFALLSAVAANQAVNQMTSTNLAIVISPNILYHEDSKENPLATGDFEYINRAVKLMIERYDDVFQGFLDQQAEHEQSPPWLSLTERADLASAAPGGPDAVNRIMALQQQHNDARGQR